MKIRGNRSAGSSGVRSAKRPGPEAAVGIPPLDS